MGSELLPLGWTMDTRCWNQLSDYPFNVWPRGNAMGYYIMESHPGATPELQGPRNKCLREFYAEARRLGDQLGVRQWIHHLRAYNKVVDAAADAAMDSWASRQGPYSCIHTDIGKDRLLAWYGATSTCA
jgi:hypothetical protein